MDRCPLQTLDANDFILSTPTLHHKGNGGAGRDRTDDILLAKQALSQLSYGPFLVTSSAGGDIRRLG